MNLSVTGILRKIIILILHYHEKKYKRLTTGVYRCFYGFYVLFVWSNMRNLFFFLKNRKSRNQIDIYTSKFIKATGHIVYIVFYLINKLWFRTTYIIECSALINLWKWRFCEKAHFSNNAGLNCTIALDLRKAKRRLL